jgi:hypothetical protein
MPLSAIALSPQTPKPHHRDWVQHQAIANKTTSFISIWAIVSVVLRKCKIGSGTLDTYRATPTCSDRTFPYLLNFVPPETLQSVPFPQEGQLQRHKNLADRSSEYLGVREFEFRS